MNCLRISMGMLLVTVAAIICVGLMLVTAVIVVRVIQSEKDRRARENFRNLRDELQRARDDDLK